MSRIYEALKLAESERTAVQQEPEPQPLPPADIPPAQESAFLVAPDAALPVMPDPALKPIDIPLAMPVASAAATAPPGLMGIVKRHWSPALQQLPALLDRGAAVEQFRSLRSRIYELRGQRPLKSIMISSGVSQEGKSFISMNLAISLARHKSSKVLLIDGDMRRCTLHKLLGCESQPGLPDYLSGKATAAEVMQQAEPMQNSGAFRLETLQNLTFIPGGNSGDQAADLSGNIRFQELVRTIGASFDWIIVDSSPVTMVSDAVNLARACDGVLLVARGGITQFEVAQRAQSELRASNVLGFVLNGVKEQPAIGSYYGYDSQEA